MLTHSKKLIFIHFKWYNQYKMNKTQLITNISLGIAMTYFFILCLHSDGLIYFRSKRYMVHGDVE